MKKAFSSSKNNKLESINKNKPNKIIENLSIFNEELYDSKEIFSDDEKTL